MSVPVFIEIEQNEQVCVIVNICIMCTLNQENESVGVMLAGCGSEHCVDCVRKGWAIIDVLHFVWLLLAGLCIRVGLKSDGTT